LADSPFVAIPKEAWQRRHADKLTSGAWELYGLYCKFRNRDTGRCDPSGQTLMREMKCTYTHVSDCKTELVKKGWIARRGRSAVELLAGTFPAPKVRDLSPQSTSKFGIFRTSTSEYSELGRRELRNIPNSTSEYSELGERTPIYEQEDQQVAAAPAAAAGRETCLQEPVTEQFVTEVVAAGVYPEPVVRHVWSKLKLHCATAGVAPVKKQFLHWLSTERPVAQPVLPQMGAPVVEGRFTSPGAPAKKAVRPPDPNCRTCNGAGKVGGVECGCTQCQYCFGSGMEILEGGARRCRCREPARAQSSGEAGLSVAQEG
jgi:hypothetical protein